MIHPGGFWLCLSVIRMMMMAFLSLFNQNCVHVVVGSSSSAKTCVQSTAEGAFCGLHLRLYAAHDDDDFDV